VRRGHGAPADGPADAGGEGRDDASVVHLRPLTEGDLGRVADLEPRLFGAGAWSVEIYAEELRAPGRAYLAAVAPDGTVIGYGGIALAEDAEVMTVGVDPEWRRRGVGEMLLGGLLSAARAARARRVFLEVRADDAGARRLYQRAGFRRIGLRRGYYQPENADAVLMRLDLVGRGPVGADARSDSASGTVAATSALTSAATGRTDEGP
jgi:ribosomal-protein-alanine N-acetyltransferase